MEHERIVVAVSANNGSVEVDIEDGFYILGIYDSEGEPVTDILLNSMELDELGHKLQRTRP